MNEETRNQIIFRHGQGASKCQIGREVGVAPRTVDRVLAQVTAQRQSPKTPRVPPQRASILDPFVPTMQELLGRYPNLTVVRMLEELQQQGYTGGYTTVGRKMKELRPKPTREPVIRFETGPGVQAQMDYAVHDLDFTAEGRRRVYLFGYTLSYSRRSYLRFVESQDFETTVREHLRAFAYFGGVAATCLYDNMKVVVSRYDAGEPIYNARFLSFATHYGYRPVACRPHRPRTKGKIERGFRYVDLSLLNGRTFRSLEHLNEVTASWLEHVADVRVHGTTEKRPIDLFAEERPHLLPLPEHPYDIDPIVYRTVDAEGFILYGRNFYSVPWRYIGSVMPVRVGDAELVIYSPKLVPVARHAKLGRAIAGQRRQLPEHRPSEDRRQQLEALKERYVELGPAAARFFDRLLEAKYRGKSQARRILALLGTYHAKDLLAALERALRFGAFSYSAIERILAVQAKPKSILETLADEEREHLRPLLTDDPVTPRPTSEYQHLLPWESDDDDETEPTRPEEEPS